MDGVVPDRCDCRVGDRIGGKYLVERALGEGTFGAVYKVSDAGGNVFALKLLKLWCVTPDMCRSLRERFVMEFETGRIESPYLAHAYAYGDLAGNPYIVMEFCPNGDLRSYAAAHPVDWITIGRQVLRGLGDLHACGKVHRDLKPENVLLREDRTAVLTDFGISGDQNKRMTERGWLGKPSQIFGTYPYMPPEQVNPPRGGQATVLPTTDIFSFGVMMYEMLAGELPFGPLTESTLPRYLENGRTGHWDRRRLQRADREGVWLPVVEGCLVPNFKERLQTIEQVLGMLPGGSEEAAPLHRSILTVRRGILLRVMQGEDYGREFRLDEMTEGCRRMLTVGRTDDAVANAIPLRDEACYVSRHHCTLEQDAATGCWYLRDGQAVETGTGYAWRPSLNGTYVNSDEADRYGLPIRPGDILSLGDVKLRVEGY